MSIQRVNELGSAVRRLHHEIMDATIEEVTTGKYSKEADKLADEFNSELLSLINQALDAEQTVKKLLGVIKQYEREVV